MVSLFLFILTDLDNDTVYLIPNTISKLPEIFIFPYDHYKYIVSSHSHESQDNEFAKDSFSITY